MYNLLLIRPVCVCGKSGKCLPAGIVETSKVRQSTKTSRKRIAGQPESLGLFCSAVFYLLLIYKTREWFWEQEPQPGEWESVVSKEIYAYSWDLCVLHQIFLKKIINQGQQPFNFHSPKKSQSNFFKKSPSIYKI